MGGHNAAQVVKIYHSMPGATQTLPAASTFSSNVGMGTTATAKEINGEESNFN